MKAMILAAGFGTRLAPLSDERPKALMPVANRPILSRIIDYLLQHGINRLVMNIHHHSLQIIEYCAMNQNDDVEIDLRWEPEILGHGGGIRNTMDFWDDEPFIVINSDILTDINLGQAYAFHKNRGGLATMILHHFERDSQILVDNEMKITDIAARKIKGRLAFTGIHIIDPELLTLIPEGKFSSIIDCYREVIKSGGKINAYLSEGHYWRDINTIRSYLTANREILSLEGTPFSVAESAHLDASAELIDWAVIGAGSRIEKDVAVKRSVIWDGVCIEKGSRIVDSIITNRQTVKIV